MAVSNFGVCDGYYIWYTLSYDDCLSSSKTLLCVYDVYMLKCVLIAIIR